MHLKLTRNKLENRAMTLVKKIAREIRIIKKNAKGEEDK